MTDIINPEGLEVRVTEYSEDLWGREGERFSVEVADPTAAGGAPPFAVGATKEAALEAFSKSLDSYNQRRQEDARREAVRNNPVSVEVVTL